MTYKIELTDESMVELIGEVRLAESSLGKNCAADTGFKLSPLVHGVPFESLDPSTVVVQATRIYPVPGMVQPYGKRATLSEIESAASVPCRPLTSADVPLERWTEHLQQYSVREDGVLVTNHPLVEWGKLTAEGRITWFVKTSIR